MGLRKVILSASLIPQEFPLSRYQNMEMFELLLDAAELDEMRTWLRERGIDTKLEIYKVWKDRKRYVRCILYADMELEDEILMNLTFDLP